MQQRYTPRGESIRKAARQLDETGNDNMGNEAVETPQKWVTTLFVQFNLVGNQCEHTVSVREALDAYHAVIRQVIERHAGLLIASANDAVLALFENAEPADDHTHIGVSAAVATMEELAALNKQRLEQNLIPFRVGIGLDTGCIAADKIRCHPFMATALEEHIHKAKGLSRLNQQAPFPAIFISRNTLDGLHSRNGYHVQNLGETFVPNLPVPVSVYALMRAYRVQQL